MAKRKDERDERIEALESALAWATYWVEYALNRPNGSGFYCAHCGAERSFKNPIMNHSPDCPYGRAMELLKGLKSRKWETK